MSLQAHRARARPLTLAGGRVPSAARNCSRRARSALACNALARPSVGRQTDTPYTASDAESKKSSVRRAAVFATRGGRLLEACADGQVFNANVKMFM